MRRGEFKRCGMRDARCTDQASSPPPCGVRAAARTKGAGRTRRASRFARRPRSSPGPMPATGSNTPPVLRPTGGADQGLPRSETRRAGCS